MDYSLCFIISCKLAIKRNSRYSLKLWEIPSIGCHLSKGNLWDEQPYAHREKISLKQEDIFMNFEFNEIRKNVELYFKEYLPQYTVLEIKRKSCNPNDSYLYMVSAKKNDGTYAVWTSWNVETGSLNHGHYDLASVEECRRIFSEYQSTAPCFAVYKLSANVKIQLFVADTEESARDFCERNHWQMLDENGFVWNLDYTEFDF